MNPSVTRTRRHPLNVLGLLAMIAAAALLTGLIIPGTTASATGVFFYEGLERVVHSRFPDVALTQTQNAPISIQPFYQHIIMYFWPLMYFCLGTIVLLMRPPRNRRSFNRSRLSRDLLIMTAVIFVFNVGHLVVRNVVFKGSSAGRTVYAYSNLDVDLASFIAQMMNFLVFSFLLAVLWHQWGSYYVERVREIESSHLKGGLEATFDVNNLDRVSTELLRWQICLGLLSTGFIVYTAIFWKQIIVKGDLRFLIEAFFAHALWLISAVLMAMPFWATWRAWRFERMRAIGELVHSPDLDAKLSALRELRPVGSWNVTTVAATVLSSIAAPLVQLMFKLFEAG